MAKLITVSENLLEDIIPYLKGTPLEKKITDFVGGLTAKMFPWNLPNPAWPK